MFSRFHTTFLSYNPWNHDNISRKLSWNSIFLVKILRILDFYFNLNKPFYKVLEYSTDFQKSTMIIIDRFTIYKVKGFIIWINSCILFFLTWSVPSQRVLSVSQTSLKLLQLITFLKMYLSRPYDHVFFLSLCTFMWSSLLYSETNLEIDLSAYVTSTLTLIKNFWGTKYTWYRQYQVKASINAS